MVKLSQRFILSTLILVYCTQAFGDESKTYSACGFDKDDARKELAQTLSVNIKSTVYEQTSVKNDNVEFNAGASRTISTEISLCDVNMTPKKGGFCASVTHDELSKCATNYLSAQMEFTVGNLPDTKPARSNRAQEWVENIKSTDGLYTFIGRNTLNQQQLKKLPSIENDLLKILDKQYVRFDIQGAAVKIVLANGKRLPNNKDIELKVNAYSYTITSPNHCTIDGKFILSAKGRETIQYNMDDYSFPELTFTSKPPNASLTIADKNARSGTTKTVKRCKGVLPYSFALNSVTKSGEVRLRPGLKKTISVKFTSSNILTTAKSYRGGKKLWQIQFHNIFPTRNETDLNLLSGVKISQITLKDSFRWGFHGAYATNADDSSAYELSAEFSLQLLDYNLGREALFIGPFVLMPSVGIEAGVAYHNIDGDSSLGDANATNWEDFYQSYFLLRPKIALDIAFNQDFSFTLSLSRSLFMNRSNIISAGLGVRF